MMAVFIRCFIFWFNERSLRKFNFFHCDMKGVEKTVGVPERVSIQYNGKMPDEGKTESNVRFIVDTNVGHLVRKLRMLGYDTLFINPIEDADLIRIAAEETRIVISADRGLFERRLLKSGKVKGFLVDTYQEHLLQLRL